jgi:hypothetical protein
MTEPANLTWTPEEHPVVKGLKLQVATYKHNRFVVSPARRALYVESGGVTVYEGQFRSAANARAYAAEIARNGGL